MNPTTYDGPRDGDYVTYVERLARASPEYRALERRIAEATGQQRALPGGQALDRLRDTLEQARGQQARGQQARGQQARGQQAVAPAKAMPRAAILGKSAAQPQRQRAAGQEWAGKLAMGLIFAGIALSGFSSALGSFMFLAGIVLTFVRVAGKIKAEKRG